MEIIPLIANNNLEAQLNSGINASTLTIPLKAGEGAAFPTTYNGSATSLGSSTTLNSTGIGATGVTVGMWIYNVTDNSHAVITAVDTNSITTTALQGGSDNTWQNSDVYAANIFAITLNKRNASGVVTTQEIAVIQTRSTDTLTVMSGKRGYGNSSASAFAADDYVNVFSIWEVSEAIQKLAIQNATDLADKADSSTVTALLNARNWKQSVKCATTAAATLASDFENGDTIDGITLATGDRVLIKDQADATENGIYTVNASGAPTRATDFDADAEIVAAVVAVEEGTTNADIFFICTNDEGDQVGTDNINFDQYGARDIASQAEAEAGASNTVIMSPLRASQRDGFSGANDGEVAFVDSSETTKRAFRLLCGLGDFGRGNGWRGFQGTPQSVSGAGTDATAIEKAIKEGKTFTLDELIFEGVIWFDLVSKDATFGICRAAAFCLDLTYDGTPANGNDHVLGVAIDQSTMNLYSKTYDGSTDENNLLESSMTDDAERYIRIHFRAGTDIRYYVNDVLAHTQTTNLPDVDNLDQLGVGTNGDGYIEANSVFYAWKIS